MPSLTTIDRYIIREFLKTFFFFLSIVIIISIVVDVVEKMDDFIKEKPPLSDIVFVYYLNFIPFWGSTLAPICVFLAVIFFTSRMAQRTELVPLLSSGVSFYRILVPYMISALLLAGLLFYLKAYLVPSCTARHVAFEYKYKLRKNKYKKNQDIHKKIARDTYLYINYYDDKRQLGHNLSMERVKDGDIISKLRAKRMVWIDSTESWRLEQVLMRDISSSGERIEQKVKLDTNILLTPDDIFIREQKAQSMTQPQLIEYTRLEEMRGSDILKELYIEQHRRYGDSVAMIILTLIGFAMSSRKSRGGVALHIGLGLMICFVFIAVLFMGQAIVGDDSPWLAVWLPNIVFLLISFILLRLVPK